MRAVVLLAASALLIGAASGAAQGPLPGDVAIARALQEVLGSAPSWAFTLTRSAVLPWAGVSVLAAAMLAWWVRGIGGSAAVFVSYGLALAADKALRAVLFVPRPAEPLVAVAAPSASSGLPRPSAWFTQVCSGLRCWRAQAALAMQCLPGWRRAVPSLAAQQHASCWAGTGPARCWHRLPQAGCWPLAALALVARLTRLRSA